MYANKNRNVIGDSRSNYNLGVAVALLMLLLPNNSRCQVRLQLHFELESAYHHVAFDTTALPWVHLCGDSVMYVMFRPSDSDWCTYYTVRDSSFDYVDTGRSNEPFMLQKHLSTAQEYFVSFRASSIPLFATVKERPHAQPLK